MSKFQHETMATSKRKRLQIIPMDPPGAYKHPKVSDPILPQHEFVLLFSADMGSGKTTVILNLLARKEFLKGYFNKIVICSPTTLADEKWGRLTKIEGVITPNPHTQAELAPNAEPKTKHQKISGENITADMILGRRPKPLNDVGKPVQKPKTMVTRENMVERIQDIYPIIEKQKKAIEEAIRKYGDEKYKKYVDKICLVIDDQAGLFTAGPNSKLNNIIYKHRHLNMSIILTTQYLKAMPAAVRGVAKYVLIFRTGSGEELEKLYKAYPAFKTKKKWMELYDIATREPHSFMYINTRLPNNQQIYRNFDELIDEEDPAFLPGK